MILSELFKGARKELELTQVELAAKLKISQSAISKIEAGNLEPTLRVFLGTRKLLSKGKPFGAIRDEFDRLYFEGINPSR